LSCTGAGCNPSSTVSVGIDHEIAVTSTHAIPASAAPSFTAALNASISPGVPGCAPVNPNGVGDHSGMLTTSTSFAPAVA